MAEAPKPELKEWSTGLCGCFDDCASCCCGFWCQPCLFGNNSSKLGGNCFCNCLLWFLCGNICCCCFTGNRKKLREAHGFKEAPCNDCCTYLFCAPCAMCQEARVLKTVGPAPQSTQFAAVVTEAPAQQEMPAYQAV